MNRHAGQACQLAIRPYIVVADEEMDINASVGKRAQTSQDGLVLLFRTVTPDILAPEIEDIPEQVDSRGIFSQLLQQLNEPQLMLRIIHRTAAYMCITKEVNHWRIQRFKDSKIQKLQESEFKLSFFAHHIFVPLRLKDEVDLYLVDTVHSSYLLTDILHQKVRRRTTGCG